MSRWTGFDWFASHCRPRRRLVTREQAAVPHSRLLRVEQLEDRRLLATVNTLSDINANDGFTTLREAMVAAVPGETINFAVTGTINLTNVGHVGELLINKNLTIQGPGADLLTINAFDPTPETNNGDGSRVLYINVPRPCQRLDQRPDDHRRRLGLRGRRHPQLGKPDSFRERHHRQLGGVYGRRDPGYGAIASLTLDGVTVSEQHGRLRRRHRQHRQTDGHQ